MEPRTGKYGDFFYCKTHGTISKQAVKVLLNVEYGPIADYVSHPALPMEDPLLDAVKRTGYAMGHHMDEMGQLVDFFNDMEESADWDEDHWMNVRPY